MMEWGINRLDNGVVKFEFRDGENYMEYVVTMDTDTAIRFHDALTQLVIE